MFAERVNGRCCQSSSIDLKFGEKNTGWQWIGFQAAQRGTLNTFIAIKYWSLLFLAISPFSSLDHAWMTRFSDVRPELKPTCTLSFSRQGFLSVRWFIIWNGTCTENSPINCTLAKDSVWCITSALSPASEPCRLRSILSLVTSGASMSARIFYMCVAVYSDYMK